MQLVNWEATDVPRRLEFQANFNAVEKEFLSRGINVKWFGAKGDGVTDDTVAIQKALDYVRDKGGGIIYFPDGKYMLYERLYIYTGTTLQGQSKTNTILLQNKLERPHIQAWDVADVTINDMLFDGQNKGGGISIRLTYPDDGRPAGYPENSRNIHFARIRIQNIIVNNGMTIQRAIMSTFTDVRTSKVRDGYGMSFMSGGTSLVLTACYASSSGKSGIRLHRISYSTLNSCASEYAPVGFEADNCQAIVLNACGSEVNDSDGSGDPNKAGLGFLVIGGYGAMFNNCYSRQDESAAIRFIGDGREQGEHTLIGFRQRTTDATVKRPPYAIEVTESGPVVTVIGANTSEPNYFAKDKANLVYDGARRTTYADAPPTSGLWMQGSIVYFSNPKPGTNVGWICTLSGRFSEQDWAPNTLYYVGDLVKNSKGVVYRCITQGTSGATEPTVTTTNTNGTVVFEWVGDEPKFHSFGTIST